MAHTSDILVTDQQWHALQTSLEQVASRDAYALSREYQQLSQQRKQLLTGQASSIDDERIKRFLSRLNASLTWVNNRQSRRPETIDYPENLPVVEKKAAIIDVLTKHQVVIVAGETGSGKTTQLPKFCLELGRGLRGFIGHTQPRRLAASSVASRIADELHSPLGDLVGYQVRFTDKVSEHSAIKLMTDGILLAEIQHDRYLSRYDTIIIDEAHERSLNIDFLLGYLKQLLPKRPDLKLIITSATIDVEKFSKHFNSAPIVNVSGRTYPVEVLYRPLLESEQDSQIAAIAAAYDEITTFSHQGDVLVFLSGERDIRETALHLRREYMQDIQSKKLSIVPLYARLSLKEQNAIFQAHQGRRIVLATNVAETSLTVPGIRYVIDPGYARVSRYSFRHKIQRLPIEPVSQASANQRKGRCGRIAEGTCIRLYSEEDFLSRPEFTDPEILRTNLASVILQMAQLKLGDVRRFPFVDMPDHRLINDGYKLLQELQATNTRHQLTALGRQVASLPVDPKFARMLYAAQQNNSLQEMLVICSALSIQDPRERPADKQQAADQRHREYWHEQSDFMAYVNLWQQCEEQRQALTNNQFKKWSQQQFLSSNRLREWRDLHKQLSLAIRQLGWRPNVQAASYEVLHRSLITGLLSNIGLLEKDTKQHQNQGDYLGARQRRFSIFPASSQTKKKPNCIAAAELIETSRLFAHTVAKVENDWVLDAAQHLVKRQYLEPHYDARSGQVMAYEKVTLYGLTLRERKAVSYGQLDPNLSRELFIRHALVEGRYAEHKRIRAQLKQSTAENHFYLHQQATLNALHDLEAKSRRRDILQDDEVLFDFYAARLPDDIVNLDGFEHWRKTQEQSQAKLLFIDRQQLMQRGDAHISLEQFPDRLQLQRIRIPLRYHFDPSHQDDGVTMQVPVAVLHLLNPEHVQWLVPGLLAEKVTAMIKALPKQWRKQFAPVPNTVSAIMPALTNAGVERKRRLDQCIAEQLFAYKGVRVPEACWDDIEIDPYYHMNIHIVDEKQRLIDRGRDLLSLKERYRDQVQNQLQNVGNDYEKSGLREWNFGVLDEQIILKQNGLDITVYPGLDDGRDSVNLRLFDNPAQALVNTLRGQVRLALLSQGQTLKYLSKNLLKGRELGLSLVDMGSREQVVDDICCAAMRQSCFDQLESIAHLPRTQADFLACVEQGKQQWVERAEAIAALLDDALKQINEIKKQTKKLKNPLVLSYAMADIQQQLKHLFYPSCLYDTPFIYLQQYSRYLRAIIMRIEKVPMRMNEDKAHIAELETLWSRYQQKVDGALTAADSSIILNPALREYRWMIEELRVSLFAQTLGTRMPVSVKRLNKQWQSLNH